MRWCQQGGLNSYLFLLKGRPKGASHQLQAPFDDQRRNGMRFNRLYESICVGFLKVPIGFPNFPMVSPYKNTIGKLGNPMGTFEYPTQMLSYDGLNIQPLHLVNNYFSSTNISSIISSYSNCLSNFVDHRMGLCEWMPWMWFTHYHTPFHSQHHNDIGTKGAKFTPISLCTGFILYPYRRSHFPVPWLGIERGNQLITSNVHFLPAIIPSADSHSHVKIKHTLCEWWGKFWSTWTVCGSCALRSSVSSTQPHLHPHQPNNIWFGDHDLWRT